REGSQQEAHQRGADDYREPITITILAGRKQVVARPGGARAARVPGVGADCRHLYAQTLPRRPFTQLAEVLEAPCPGHLGVRLLLGSHDLLPDAARLLRDAPRNPRDPAGSGESRAQG